MNQNEKRPAQNVSGRIILIAGVAIIGLVILFRFIAMSGERALDLANTGLEMLMAGKFEQAEEKFRSAQAREPSAAFAEKTRNPSLTYIGLGNKAFNEGEYAAAARFYVRAYDLDSTIDLDKYAAFGWKDRDYEQGAYIQIGNLFWQEDHLKLAEKAYLRSLQDNPNYAPALTNLGNINRRRDNLDAAMEYYNRALAADPAALEARVNILNLVLNYKIWATFQFHLDKLRQYHAENPITEYYLGQNEFRMGKYDSALMHFQKMIDRRPGDIQATLALIDTYLKLERTKEAQELLQKAALEHGPIRALRERAVLPAEAAFRKKELRTAKSYYEAMGAIWPDDPEFRFGAANCMIHLDEDQEALAIMEDLVQKYPESSVVLTNLGIVYAAMGKREWAKEQFEAAIDIDSSGIAYYNLGKIYELEGDTTRANSCYMIAAVKEPDVFNMEEYMMRLKEEKSARIARGDTAGLIFRDK